jgi:sugar-specific transcriptional regulator TrmB
MTFQLEDLAILNDAGLTTSEAKIYLTLASNGKQTIKSLAKLSDVDRANTYREIQKLEELDLVRKTLDVPNIYEAIPLRDCISILLTNKKKEYEKTKKNLDELCQHFCCRQGNFVENEKNLFIIPKRTSLIRTSIRYMKEIQFSNDIISSVKRFSQSMNYPFFEIHRSALERGVRIRLIVEEPRNEEFLTDEIRDLMAYRNFEMRYSKKALESLGSCFDNNRLLILIDPLADVEESPVFCTYHNSFVAMFREYFESLWQSAVPCPTEESASIRNSSY